MGDIGVNEEPPGQLAVADDQLGAAVVDVPSSWTIPVGSGQNVMAFADLDSHVGQDFLPNVTLRIDPVDSDDGLGASFLVLSDHTIDNGRGRCRTRMLVSTLPDAALVQQVTTVTSERAVATVVASATESQWPSLADAFDAVSASIRLERDPS